ncbi:MAG TPA: cytochrome c [Thermoanaerobaculia bacterium]|nr:cytochrome c [Thermoanaerobaculia bacterium]
MHTARLTSAAIALLVTGVWTGGSAGATDPLQRAADAPADGIGFFSNAQAERGQARYAEACKECHPTSQFRGPDFEWRWRRQTAWELFDEIVRSMPENGPGTLPPETYADIVAYLLSLNDYPAGGPDLAPAREALAEIPLGAGVAKTRSPE